MERLKITNFSDNNLRLLMEINERKVVTSRTQRTYSPFAFYLNIQHLQKHGLVIDDGLNEKRRKEWSLSERGKTVVEHIGEIEEVLT